MPQVFDVDSTSWHQEQIRLSEILSDEEHRSARATTLNAHYTAPAIVRAMYQAAERFGFSGGRIVEPACGIAPQPTYLTSIAFSSGEAGRSSASSARTISMALRFCENFCLGPPAPRRSSSEMR